MRCGGRMRVIDTCVVRDGDGLLSSPVIENSKGACMNRTGLALVISIGMALTGCGKDNDVTAPKSIAGTGAGAEVAESAAPDIRGSERADRGDCVLLRVEDIHAAFGDKLRVDGIGGGRERGSGCEYNLAGFEHGQILLQTGDRASYEMRRDAAQGQRGVTIESIALGQEAYIINDAQVIVLDAQGRSISLGLILIAFGGQLPVTGEESAVAMKALAAGVLERME